jgi:hypothetical protein
MADTKTTGLTGLTAPALTDLLYAVDDPGGTPVSTKLEITALQTLLGRSMTPIIFYPADNSPPSSNFATLDLRNAHMVLDFDTTTGESAVFTGILPLSYGGGGITVEVAYSMESATTGTCGFTVEVERVGDSQQDIDSDSFATAATITAVTVPGTTGHVDVVSVNISNGANMDSVAAGEQFRLRITRDVASDTAAGDAELHWVRVREQ